MPKHKTISMSELTKHAERIATDIESSGAVYQIKRRGGPSMVLMDSGYLESLRLTIQFMTEHPNWEAEMEQGRQEILAGGGVSLEELFKRHGLDVEARPSRSSKPSARSASKHRGAKSARGSARSRARAS